MEHGQKLIIRTAQEKRPTILKAHPTESKLHMYFQGQWTTTKDSNILTMKTANLLEPGHNGAETVKTGLEKQEKLFLKKGQEGGESGTQTPLWL